MTGEPVVILSEIVEVLARYGGLRCVPQVESAHGIVTVTIVVPLVALEAVELLQDVQYAVDVAQARAFFVKYGIDPSALNAAIERRSERGV